jgi:phosphoribosyl 1,2-cyclic phosphodiesterase
MLVRFWGTRGSIPVALTAPQVRAKVVAALHAALDAGLTSHDAVETLVDTLPFEVVGTFGGHSSCVQVQSDGAEHVFLDFGTGARPLAGHYLARHPRQPQTYHVFMSHLHWDHIMGFPFFTPIYIPGNRIVIHSCHTQVEQAFRQQQAGPCFPVPFDALAARIEFDVLQPDQTYDIAGYQVTALKQLHEGDSYGWRLQRASKTLVYSTDSEHKLDQAAELERFVKFFDRADLVVFDAMYSLADAISIRADWGHSSNMMGIELCQAAHARQLALFHHEPVATDARLARELEESRLLERNLRSDHALHVITAYDGLEVVL